MKVTIFLSDGGQLNIDDFDAESAMDLAAMLPEQQFHTFEMDGATVIVNRDHIVRVDLD